MDSQTKARIVDLNARLRAWDAKVQVEFSKLFNPGDPKLTDWDRVGEFGHLAESRVGEGPHEELYLLFDVVCSKYLQGTPEERDTIRSFIQDNHSVLSALGRYVGKATDHLASTGDTQWLMLALAAISIENLQIDYRDTYYTLGTLFIIAVEAGVNPVPYFEQVGSISDTHKQFAGSGTTRDFLTNFLQSEFFKSSVKPKLNKPFDY